MALILRYLVEFGSFRSPLRKSVWLAINIFSPKKCHKVHQPCCAVRVRAVPCYRSSPLINVFDRTLIYDRSLNEKRSVTLGRHWNPFSAGAPPGLQWGSSWRSRDSERPNNNNNSIAWTLDLGSFLSKTHSNIDANLLYQQRSYASSIVCQFI